MGHIPYKWIALSNTSLGIFMAALDGSITLIFTLVTAGLASSLPTALYNSLTKAGLAANTAQAVAGLPPTAALFAAFLGYNPLRTLIPPQVLASLPAAAQTQILSTAFFPTVISGPFEQGLLIAFSASVALSVLAAAASYLRGRRYIHELEGVAEIETGEPTV